MLPWGLPGCQVALAAHTQVPLYAEPFSNEFWYKTSSWFTTQPQQSTNITLHHSLRTFNLFPWPDRWTVPTSPQYLSPLPPLLHTIPNPIPANLTSYRYEGNVVQNSFTSPTDNHPWKPDSRMLSLHSGIIAGAIHKGENILLHWGVELGLSR